MRGPRARGGRRGLRRNGPKTSVRWLSSCHPSYRTSMTLFLAICLGIGLALGVGLRPFLPALLVGALASADVGIDFDGTDLSFLEDPYFLLALLAGVIFLVIAE